MNETEHTVRGRENSTPLAVEKFAAANSVELPEGKTLRHSKAILHDLEP